MLSVKVYIFSRMFALRKAVRANGVVRFRPGILVM